jgi:hypothetical protein
MCVQASVADEVQIDGRLNSHNWRRPQSSAYDDRVGSGVRRTVDETGSHNL